MAPWNHLRAFVTWSESTAPGVANEVSAWKSEDAMCVCVGLTLLLFFFCCKDLGCTWKFNNALLLLRC